jgi:hypothetical protein
MHKLLPVAGLLFALLVRDSSNEVLAQREGGAFWGAFSRGNSSGASMFPLAARQDISSALVDANG